MRSGSVRPSPGQTADAAPCAAARAAGAAAPRRPGAGRDERGSAASPAGSPVDRLAETHVERAVRERSRLRVVLATGGAKLYSGGGPRAKSKNEIVNDIFKS